MGDKRDRAARTPESAGPSAVNTDRQTPAKNAVLERDGQADARAARYFHREQREVDAVRALYQADPRKRYAHGERGREKLREKREIDKVLRFRVHGLDLAADLDTSNGTPLADKQEFGAKGNTPLTESTGGTYASSEGNEVTEDDYANASPAMRAVARNLGLLPETSAGSVLEELDAGAACSTPATQPALLVHTSLADTPASPDHTDSAADTQTPANVRVPGLAGNESLLLRTLNPHVSDNSDEEDSDSEHAQLYPAQPQWRNMVWSMLQSFPGLRPATLTEAPADQIVRAYWQLPRYAHEKLLKAWRRGLSDITVGGKWARGDPNRSALLLDTLFDGELYTDTDRVNFLTQLVERTPKKLWRKVQKQIGGSGQHA